jgi:serine/threonine-protein kinase HipA
VLDVLLYDQPVGTLASRGRGLLFRYAKSAVADTAVPPISLALPKREEPYPDSAAGPFFRNLLPEAAYGFLVAAAVGKPPENAFALLGAIGRECPGAISIWPRGERPGDPPTYEPLSETDLDALFSRDDQRRFARAHSQGRLTLAGAQEKIALLRDGAGNWSLPLNGAVTSHILKPATGELEHLLENEVYCMLLADAAGIGVASVGIAGAGEPVFCTARFDRIERDGSVLRLHQEDFCQALAVDPAHKYEHDGGPGIERCAETIRLHSVAPELDLDRLVRWVGFSYLVGNEDAHAKNLALLHLPGGTRLAPFYDIVSTEVYPGLERGLSMQIGRNWNVRNVQADDWQRLAGQVELPEAAVRDALAGLIDRVEAAMPQVADRAESLCGPARAYAAVGRIVAARLARLSSDLARVAGTR